MRHLGPHGLDALDTLSNGPRTVKQIAADCGRPYNLTHQVLIRLLDAGLVDRSIPSKRRKRGATPYQWRITPEGQHAAADALDRGRVPGGALNVGT